MAASVGPPAPRAEPAVALAVERLAVPFGDRAGLVDITFSVARGERLAVLGPSGAGKTTLLRTVAGLAPVGQGGRVVVGGRDVTALPPERRNAVYLHQVPVLFPHLSVAENVAFPLRVRGERGPTVVARVHEALAAVRLADLAGRAPSALSGGQRQRVALARAMAAHPAVLLLDEPLASLDPALRDDVRAAIEATSAPVGAEAPGLVIVTHDLDDAGLLADRVAVLVGGRIAQIATPPALFTRPASLAVARYLGLFQELQGRVRDDGGVVCALGVVPASSTPALPAGGAAIVAFRADAVRVMPDVPEGAVPARVTAVRHRARGSGLVLRLDVPAGGGSDGVEIESALPGDREVPAAGTCVGVRLDTCRAIVFPG